MKLRFALFTWITVSSTVASAARARPDAKHDEPTIARNAVASGQLFRVMSVNSGMALDVEYVSTQPGARVHQWSYVQGKNQMWQFEPTPTAAFNWSAPTAVYASMSSE